MSDSSSEVRLGTTEALDDAKAAIARFAEEARAVVTGMDLDLRRAWHWLDREMPAYWEGRIKRLEFELSEARNSLFRKKLQTQGTDRAGSAFVEKEEVRRLERLLEESRARLPLIRKWRVQLERELDEFHSRTRGIRDIAEGGFERPIDLLNRMANAIDAYSATTLPRRDSDPSSQAAKPETPADHTERESDA
ncbi:hypothetical protein GC170_17365 [bacterium]|nr:hypothetical protein [bacterium]